MAFSRVVSSAWKVSSTAAAAAASGSHYSS
jgi:hypothetical protein